VPDHDRSPEHITEISTGVDLKNSRDTASDAHSTLQEGIRRREEEFRLIVESATDFAIIATDFEGRVTTWNTGAERLLGYEEAEIIGRNAAIIFTPEDRASGRPQREMQLALENGRAEDERWHLRKDGSRFWASGLLMPLKDERDGVRGFLKIMRDRTAQQETEGALRASEAELRLAIDAGGMAVWELDLKRDRIVSSVELNRLLGFPAEAKPTTDEIRARYHPDDRERVRSAAAEALARGDRLVDLEFRYLHPDGSIRWLNIRAEVQFDTDGAPNRAFGVLLDLSERKRAEDSLREIERRLDAVLKNTRMAIFLMDESQQCVYANTAAETLTGYTFAEMQGRSLHEVIHHKYPDGRPYPIEECPIDRAFPERAQMQGEEMFVHKDGSFYPVAFTASPVLDDGEPVGTVIEARNIADEKAREAAARESEERFRLVAESAPVMLWMGDPQGKCLYLNKAQREFWGVPLAEVPNFDWNMTTHPNDAQALAGPFAEGMRTRSGFSAEARYRRTDGEYRILHTEAQPRFGPGGEFLGMIGVNVDVTDTRRADEAVRREARLLEVVNETGAAVAAERDLDRIVQIITDAGVELSGAQFGAFFYNVINDKGESYTLYALSGVPREAFSKFPMPRNTHVFGPTFRGEGVVRCDDITADPRYGRNAPYKGMPEGHLPVRSYLAVPVASRSGEVIGGLFFGHEESGVFQPEHEKMLLGVAGHAAIAIDNARLFQAAEREIAVRRRAEEALQALNHTLEQRVEEEVAERSRAEEALRQSQKMEAVGQLTGGIAHDFNNMLAVVIGGLNLLQRRLAKGDTDIGKYIEAAMDGASRAATLTQRLLAFSRQQPLAPEPLNANKLVSGMSELLTRTLGENIRIETVLAAGLWQTHTDPGQLESAILNLAVNARDAMVEGGRLTIETANAHVDDDYARDSEISVGQYVLICVTDTGSGMTPEIISKAFDPFFTTKAVGKGTGLGLSQVFGFVRQSGGHVKIYSELGHGTTVKVYLPRFYGEAAPTARRRSDAPAGAGRAQEIILVVEDEERVRNYTVEALRDLGYTVVHASGGPEALRLIEAGQDVTLLFTDVVMPDMNGRQLAEAAVTKLPKLKVLYTTGYTRNAVVHNGTLEPGTNFLPKPFGIDQLAAKVRTVLDSTEHA
jgi:PAS domain S-box-containing protein